MAGQGSDCFAFEADVTSELKARILTKDGFAFTLGGGNCRGKIRLRVSRNFRRRMAFFRRDRGTSTKQNSGDRKRDTGSHFVAARPIERLTTSFMISLVPP